mmetsp:Transcript_19538/g.28404  ORF Transcript_19538/g.28404 Transcript_19538/m.28404 type:complete len:97 (-) Transcript_19538:547-837(-)|eukprot:7193968-Ditylum_brightwellii.AAC.1
MTLSSAQYDLFFRPASHNDNSNNLDEVRDEWERIKLSYEILSDPKMRLRYDRNTAIADPGAAVGRAALGAVGWGFSSVGKGLLGVGEMALKQMKKD